MRNYLKSWVLNLFILCGVMVDAVMWWVLIQGVGDVLMFVVHWLYQPVYHTALHGLWTFEECCVYLHYKGNNNTTI
jgi:hypothetical protein